MLAAGPALATPASMIGRSITPPVPPATAYRQGIDFENAGPAYSTDTDQDGVVDAWDPCPAQNTISTGPPSRDPSCYRGLSWPLMVLAGVASSMDAVLTEESCVPGMAIPIDDTGVDRVRRRGVVLLGLKRTTNPDVTAAAKAGLPWPSSAAPVAQCLASLDFADGYATYTQNVGIATFYSRYSAAVSAPTDRYSSRDSLGLIVSDLGDPRGNGIVSLLTRVPWEDRLDRMRFSRGVLYAPSLTDVPQFISVTESTTYDDQHTDPTRSIKVGPIRNISVTAIDVRQIQSDSFKPPRSWRVVPTGMDAAILANRTALIDAYAGEDPSTLGNQVSAEILKIDGVPTIRVDDPSILGADPITQSILALFLSGLRTGTGGELYTPKHFGAPFLSSSDPFIAVPAAIATLDQAHRSTANVVGHRPAGVMRVSKPKQGDVLMLQKFSIDDYVGQEGVYTRGIETVFPHLSAGTPPSATSEANPRYGTRWTSNGSRADCWYDGFAPFDGAGADHALPYPGGNADGDAIAALQCPAALLDWWNSAPTSQSVVDTTCAGANAVNGWGNTVSGLVSGVVNPTCGITIGASAGSCAGCFLSLGFWGSSCDRCVNDTGEEPARCAIDGLVKTIEDVFPNDWHWVDVSTNRNRSPVPLTGIIRREDSGKITMRSFMPAGDFILNHAHQANDWNWDADALVDGVSDPLPAIDPMYRRLSLRDGSYANIENEIELQIPRGKWKDNPHGLLDWENHGYPDTFLLKNTDFAGEVWPDEFCDLFGVYKDDDKWMDAPSVPSVTCGHEPIWRSHYGRGMFSPLNDATLNDPQTSRMALDEGWPKTGSSTPNVGLGVEDWGDYPHRLSFLGDPIIDCGHGGGKVEIHPPHLLTMDVANGSWPDGGSGVVVAVFGWVNVTIEGRLEFDVWPPPRPNAAAEFRATGHDERLSSVGLGPEAPDSMGYGYVIDASGPWSSGDPTLTCTPAPTLFPNHLHCVYLDPGGMTGGVPRDLSGQDSDFGEGEGEMHRLPRMTPYYSSSRFDMRVLVGWK